MTKSETIESLQRLVTDGHALTSRAAWSNYYTRWRINCINVFEYVFGKPNVYVSELEKYENGHRLRGVAAREHSSERKDYLNQISFIIGLLGAAIDDLQERDINKFKEMKMISCFLIYRFNDKGKNYASEVKEFLELNGISVITGEEYEPRSISQKVKEKLANVDFGIAIVEGTDQQSIWTRDEVVRLDTLDKPVIFLVSQRAKFESGIFGDIEVIYFSPNHIGDAFKKLLQGIKRIK